LEIRTPALWENDRAVRAAFGETPERTLFLARGDTPATARSALDEFAIWLRREHPEAALSSVGLALPSPQALRALPQHLGRLDDFERELRDALDRQGFDAAGFNPFFAAWREFRAQDDHASFDELL